VTFNPKLYNNADDYLEAFNKYSTVLEVMDEGKQSLLNLFFSQKNETQQQQGHQSANAVQVHG
jgi:hypothetical protein